MAILKTEALESGYDKVMILHGLNINIDQGEIVSVIGRNGIGKSTLMKTIIGLSKTSSGKIYFEDKNVTRSRSYERAWKGVGYVPQGHMVFPGLTVEENLMMGENINRVKNRKPDYAMIYDYFPKLKERRTQLAGTMSGGEQAMLSIGRVMTGNVKLMLLDEPSEGVQPNIVEQIGEIILRINKEIGLTVLLVEQHIGLIQMVSQRCYAMDKGSIQEELNHDKVMDYDYIKKYLSV